MKRVIPFSELKKAVDEAYEKFKSEKEGEVDPMLEKPAHEQFGIAVCLADGTQYSKADADVKSPLGGIGDVAVASVLLSQNTPEELLKKSGLEKGCCKKNKPEGASHKCSCPRGVRAVSAIEPTGDPDSKWNFIENRMIDLMGSAPELNDNLYKAMKDCNQQNDVVNNFEKSGFYLYDSAATSLDLFTRLHSMQASAKQLAVLGATIAADGVNPETKQVVYDGGISQTIVAMMAAKGPHHASAPWLIASGLPAKSSFGGAIAGVFPGVMGLAAYSPETDANGISVKGAKALAYIMNKLGISVFGSASVEIDTKA